MIFITFGTERYPFARLAEAAERVARELPDEEVVVQIGYHPTSPRGCTPIRWLGFEQLSSHIRNARVVAGHAGAGTILTCNELGRIPVVLPRLHALGEHLDDHQGQLARRMSGRGRIIQVASPEEASNVIAKIEPHESRLDANVAARVPDLAVALARYITDRTG